MGIWTRLQNLAQISTGKWGRSNDSKIGDGRAVRIHKNTAEGTYKALPHTDTMILMSSILMQSLSMQPQCGSNGVLFVVCFTLS